jgi:hypothetical protein
MIKKIAAPASHNIISGGYGSRLKAGTTCVFVVRFLFSKSQDHLVANRHCEATDQIRAPTIVSTVSAISHSPSLRKVLGFSDCTKERSCAADDSWQPAMSELAKWGKAVRDTGTRIE